MLNVGKCMTCNLEFKLKTRGSRIYPAKYCSSKCCDFSYRKSQNKNCRVCNKALVGFSRKTVYCSEKCSNIVRNMRKQSKNMSRDKICKTCLKYFLDTGKNNQKEFCSTKCLNMAQRSSTYGLSPNQYLEMKKEIKCPTCLNDFNTSSRIQCIDHCHVTGEVRGLICRKCNTILGYASDNIQTLERLIKYLERSNAPR